MKKWMNLGLIGLVLTAAAVTGYVQGSNKVEFTAVTTVLEKIKA